MIFFIFMCLLSYMFGTIIFLLIGLAWLSLGWFEKQESNKIKEIKIEGNKEL